MYRHMYQHMYQRMYQHMYSYQLQEVMFNFVYDAYRMSHEAGSVLKATELSCTQQRVSGTTCLLSSVLTSAILASRSILVLIFLNISI